MADVEEKTKDNDCKRKLIHKGNYNFLGFTLFDIFHIIFGVTFIIIYCLEMRGASKEEVASLNQSIAFEGIELFFAVILIAFVDGIAEMAKEKEHVGFQAMTSFYLFAWLVVCGALLTPELIKFPERVEEGMNMRNVFYFAEVALELFASFCFLLTVFFPKKWKIRPIVVYIGILAIGLSIPCSIAQDYLPFEGYISILETFSQIAPLAPVIFSIISFHDIDLAAKERKKLQTAK